MSNNEVVAIIPARSGSKRLVRKNLRPLNGVPLVVHSIREAINCSEVQKTIVTTDSFEIADVARSAGCDVHMRSAELSSDQASTIDVLKDVLSNIEPFGICVTLQPTSPLRISEDISASLRLYQNLNADAFISVCRAEHPPHWINRIGEFGEMDTFLPDSLVLKRSQDFGEYYRLNGAIYCNNVSRLLRSNTQFFTSKSYAYVMPVNRSVDIDTMDDFDLAEYYMSKFPVDRKY